MSYTCTLLKILMYGSKSVAWVPAKLPQSDLVGKVGLGGGSVRKTLYTEQELFGPIKLSGRALYDDGQMINSNVTNHFTK